MKATGPKMYFMTTSEGVFVFLGGNNLFFLKRFAKHTLNQSQYKLIFDP